MPETLQKESLVLVEELFKRILASYYTTYKRSRETFIMPAECTTAVYHADMTMDATIAWYTKQSESPLKMNFESQEQAPFKTEKKS